MLKVVKLAGINAGLIGLICIAAGPASAGPKPGAAAICTGSDVSKEPVYRAADECSEGERRCDGNRVVVCQNGRLVVVEVCSNGCQNGQCAQCSGSERRCDGNRVVACQNGRLVVVETCARGCSNGACQP